MNRVLPGMAPVVAAVWLLCTPSASVAQALADGPRLAAATRAVGPEGPVSLLAVSEPLVMAEGVRPTHWKEGGIVGGVILGGLGAWVGVGMCSDSEQEHGTGSCILAGLAGGAAGALLGFGVGALIGGQFPKGEEPEATESE